MLTLNNVQIGIQHRGIYKVIYLRGEKPDIEARFNSFWNHGATDKELEWLTPTLACFWTTWPKLVKAMTNAALFGILQEENTKGTNPYPRAKQIALQRINDMEVIQRLPPPQVGDVYSIGVIRAERPVGDMTDVLCDVLERTAGHKGFNVVNDEDDNF